MKGLMKATIGLGFLALLGVLGGCNLQRGGGSTGEPPCPNPLFGSETPGYVCLNPNALKNDLLEQADHIPPADIWKVGETKVLAYNGADGVGPTLGFVRLPGFPEHRFLVYNSYIGAEGIFTPCPLWPPEDCYLRWMKQHGPQYAVFPVSSYPVGSVLSNYFPAVVGKGGSTEATLEWITQYWGPKDLSLLRDPFDYQRRMQTDPDPHAYKTYTYRRTYRAVFSPGRNVRVELGPFRAERAPQYDGKPLARGYNVYGIDMAEFWRWPLGRGSEPPIPPSPELKDRLYGLQFYWENQAYYAFQEASGIQTPPYPLCQPGMGYRVHSLGGFVVFRNKNFPYDRYPLSVYEEANPVFPPPVLSYKAHKVLLVGQEVIAYEQDGGAHSSGVGYTIYHPLEFHPEGYPGYTRGLPEDLARYPLWGEDPPGRTFRLAILYRFTMQGVDPGEWRPDPSHPVGEDNWHIVWSDVKIAGTRDNPDCSVEAIGYHMYDWDQSRELDAYFGLEEKPAPQGTGFSLFFPTETVLTRLNSRHTMGGLTVPVGSVVLPDWALPPGW